MNNYNILLGITYFNRGFFNAGIVASNNLGTQGEELKLILSNKTEILTTINRNANRNNNVRIYGGNLLRDFIQENFQLYDIMEFEILNPNVIRII